MDAVAAATDLTVDRYDRASTTFAAETARDALDAADGHRPAITARLVDDDDGAEAATLGWPVPDSGFGYRATPGHAPAVDDALADAGIIPARDRDWDTGLGGGPSRF